MIALACDHGGFDMKQIVIEYLEENGIAYKDFGCYEIGMFMGRTLVFTGNMSVG